MGRGTHHRTPREDRRRGGQPHRVQREGAGPAAQRGVCGCGCSHPPRNLGARSTGARVHTPRLANATRRWVAISLAMMAASPGTHTCCAGDLLNTFSGCACTGSECVFSMQAPPQTRGLLAHFPPTLRRHGKGHRPKLVRGELVPAHTLAPARPAWHTAGAGVAGDTRVPACPLRQCAPAVGHPRVDERARARARARARRQHAYHT